MSDQAANPAPQGKQVVLGLGNVLRGDDGVGPAVIEALNQQVDHGADVRLVDGGTPGLETVLHLEGCDRAIIIDAAHMGLAPGKWARFTPHEATLRGEYTGLRGTLHGAGLAEALELGEALGILPDDIVIYGVQPQIIGWTTELSDAVARSIPAVCAAIRADLQGR